MVHKIDTIKLASPKKDLHVYSVDFRSMQVGVIIKQTHQCL